MANLMITGGAGFIGTNFVNHWRKASPTDSILVLDALTYAGNRENLVGLEGIEFVEGDICNTPLVSKLMADHKIDTIVHFAAESHVDRSITGPDDFINTNIVGTHSLLKAAKVFWLDDGSGKPHRFHHVSTDEVYGSLGIEDPAFTEATPYAPNSPYSASKAGSDHLVRAYHHTFGLQTTISNCSNNYGAYQFPEKLIPLFIVNSLRGQRLPIYGDGMNIRDWLHVEDHCSGIELILKRGRIGEVYNIGGGQEIENIKIIDEICSQLDEMFFHDRTLAERFPLAPASKGKPTSTLKEYVRDRKGHDRRYAINESKIRTELDYKPARTFRQGLQETLLWYLHNEIWWKSIIRNL